MDQSEDQSELIPWKEPLLMQIGASCYLKIPSNAKQQYKDLKLQNPTCRLTKESNAVKLTYEWKTDDNGNIIKD